MSGQFHSFTVTCGEPGYVAVRCSQCQGWEQWPDGDDLGMIAVWADAHQKQFHTAAVPSREGALHYRAPGNLAIACGTRPGKRITQRSTAVAADVTCTRCWRNPGYRAAVKALAGSRTAGSTSSVSPSPSPRTAASRTLRPADE